MGRASKSAHAGMDPQKGTRPGDFTGKPAHAGVDRADNTALVAALQGKPARAGVDPLTGCWAHGIPEGKPAHAGVTLTGLMAR